MMSLVTFPWKPGDYFAIREPTDNGVPEPRYYRGSTNELPDPNSLHRHVPAIDVNRTIVYTVNAVVEFANWTAIRFENKEEDWFGRKERQHLIDHETFTRARELNNLLEEPGELLWIMARVMDIPYCRKVGSA
jgi:hypothetical protein